MSEAGEHEAVRALWENSSQRLRGWFAQRTRSTNDADDLVQETFARVQARIGQLRDGERLGAWVGAIAANVLADHRRKGSRSTASLEDPNEVAAFVNTDSVANDNTELRSAVAGWVEAFHAKLDAEDSALLRAVDLEGRPQVDVARDFGLPPSSVRSSVQRARMRLRKLLEACCTFAFDARGGLTQATRREGSDCECDSQPQSPCS